MPIAPIIRDVFGYFQNLNLLALLRNLDQGQTVREAWSANASLCPVAHGLSAGRQVEELNILTDVANLSKSCDYAARILGADPLTVLRFVRNWDENIFGKAWLLRQLAELWDERRADAEAMQYMLQAGDGPGRENELNPEYPIACPSSSRTHAIA